jgi:hypothetical protein
MNKLVLLFLLSFFLSPFSSPAQTGIDWDDPVTVAPAGFGNQHPRISTRYPWNPLIIWGQASSNKVYFSRRDGLGFTPPVAVNPPSIPVFAASWAGPDMASHGDTVYVVFKETPEHLNSIFMVHSFDGGTTFSDPVQVDHLSGDDLSRFPSVTTDADGQPLVAFMKFDANFSNARYVVTRSDDFGSSFGPDVLASEYSGGDVCDCCPASIVASGDRVATLYRDNLNNLRNSWAGISTDGGASFPTGIQIDQTDWYINACPSSGPDGVIIGDSLYSVFMSGAGGGTRVYFSVASILTGQAGPSIPLTGSLTNVSDQNYPRIAHAGPSVAVVVKQTVNNDAQLGLFFNADITAGGPWTYQMLSSNNIANADIAMEYGHIHVAWEDVTTGTVRYVHGDFTSLLCSNVTSAGAVCCDQTLCAGDTVAAFTETVAPAGGSGELNYLWSELLPDGPNGPYWAVVPGATGPDFQPDDTSGTHYFMREVQREFCTDFLSSNIVKLEFLDKSDPACAVSGSEEPPASAGGIVVSPNPVSGQLLTVQLKDPVSGPATYGVTDISGKVWVRAASNLEAGLLSADISALPAGLYLLRMSHGDQNFSVRFIKQEGR